MSSAVQYLEEMIFEFMKYRKDVFSRADIEEKLTDDEIDNLKDYCFEILMDEVNWKVILNIIDR